MHQSARLLAAGTLWTILLAPAGLAQVNIQPTPAPAVTAENEAWYKDGDPIMFAGNLYYRAGPAIHFIANEMVRSAFHEGIPLYSRTTIEPYSVVFVPMAGGMMQPYERRRTGDLAGTSGSSVAALPVDMPSVSAPPATPLLQAAAPPMLGSTAPAEVSSVGREPVDSREPQVEAGNRPSSPPIGTTGRVGSSPRSSLRVRPGSANGIFVEYKEERWFSSGPPIARDSRAFKQIGEFGGFPVYVAPQAGDSTIYIPVARGVDALAPFSKRN
jgi:hypothetical protein